MKRYLKDLGKAFGLKIAALVFLALFFSYYKTLYPKPSLDRELIYKDLTLKKKKH